MIKVALISASSFFNKSVLGSFSVLCNFYQKNIGTKVACKILAKLTSSVYFTNILQAAFH